MSLTRFLIGIVLLAAVAISVGGGARALRTRLLPAWAGSQAVLVDAVLALTHIVLLAEILGALHLFRLFPMVVAAVSSGAGIWFFSCRRPMPVDPTIDAERTPTRAPTRTGRGLSVVCVVVVGVLAASWSTSMISALRHGVNNVDSTWYHLPVAARFVQEGAVTDVHYLDGGALTAFYPASVPLLHGFGMMLLGSDLLSGVLNLAFLALTLLAAWCLGRPFGVAPATLVAASAVLATPMLVTTQPGGAYNDIVGIGMLVASLAILANGDVRSGSKGVVEVRIAALASGLALGTKYQYIVPVMALTLGVIAIAPRGFRVRRCLDWLGPVAIAGGFYYVRNLLVVGNPVPAAELRLGPLSLPRAPSGIEEIAPAAVLGESSLVRLFVIPGMRTAFGPAWWVLLALVVAGVVLGVVVGGTLFVRMLGAVGLVSLLGYAFSPASLGTRRFPIEFVYSLRYAAAGILLAVVTLPLVPAFRGRRTWYPTVVCSLFVAFTQLDPGIWPTELRVSRFAEPVRGASSVAGIAVGIVVVAVGIALVVGRERADPPRVPVAGVAILGVCVLAAGAFVHGAYVRNRYANRPYLPAVARWAAAEHDERIAIVGTPIQYPLYGKDLSNYVQYVGERGPHGAFANITDCATWRRALNEGNYSYVLTAPNPLLPKTPIEEIWTRSDPATTIEMRDGLATVFRIDGDLDPETCRQLGANASVATATEAAS